MDEFKKQSYLRKEDSKEVKELIAGAQQGCDKSFDALYVMYKASVASILFNLTKGIVSKEDIDDLTQDVFIIVLKKIHTFNGDALFRTWLYRVAVNTYFMEHRRGKQRLRQITVSLEELKNTRCDDLTINDLHEMRYTDQILNHTADRVTLIKAIDNLPPGCRGVFIAHEIEGYRHDEIAELKDHSIGNSKSQLNKAKRKLRKMLSIKIPKIKATTSRIISV